MFQKWLFFSNCVEKQFQREDQFLVCLEELQEEEEINENILIKLNKLEEENLSRRIVELIQDKVGLEEYHEGFTNAVLTYFKTHPVMVVEEAIQLVDFVLNIVFGSEAIKIPDVERLSKEILKLTKQLVRKKQDENTAKSDA